MEDLPKDVLFDILLRVPVRTIASCRCVCKTWRKLVSHSSFVNSHLSISRPQACLMVHHRSRFDIKKSRTLKLVELSIDNAIGHDPSCIEFELGMVKRSSNTEHIFTPVGSVNGLICLLVYDPIDIDKQIYICNPITNDYTIIPKHYSSNEKVRYGFGVSIAGEYKVIRVLWKYLKDLTEIEVYTLGTDQWRNLGRVPNYVSAIIDETLPGLAWNGRVHWLYHDIIYAFDLDNETFLQIPTPSGEEWKIFPFLGVLKGCLSLFARSQSYDNFSV
ncbi:F-box associated domain containing protein [Tanacetum coccineum]